MMMKQAEIEEKRLRLRELWKETLTKEVANAYVIQILER